MGEEISFLTCDHADLGTLVKKIHDREAADIKKKHILTSVEGRPGNIHTFMGNDEEEENGAGIDESKSNEDDSTPMLRRVKNTQRLRAIEANRKEREKNKEALSVLVAQSAAALAAASSSSGQGINENVAELKIEQKHLKRKVEQIENKVADLNTNVAELNTNVEGMRQEFSNGVSRIEALITKNMRRN
jgi:FtsZ-binding cell division protein ZapB